MTIMKYGDYIVMLEHPYEEYIGGMYTLANEEWYGTFQIEKFADEDVCIENASLIRLKPVRGSDAMLD